MYDHDVEDIDVLGWEEFVLRQWESIYLGYRGSASIRTVGRRWCDLLEAGIGCSQQVADELVKNEIVERGDHVLFEAASPSELVAEMTDVLNGFPRVLRQMDQIPPDQLAAMIEQHARLVKVVAGDADQDDD